MLVCGGMENDMRPEILESPPHGIYDSNIGEIGLDGNILELLAGGPVDLEQVVFREIQEPQGAGMITAHLPDELAADGASRTRNQDPLVLIALLDQVRIQPNLFAPQQILEPDIPDRLDGNLAPDQLTDAGHHAETLSAPRTMILFRSLPFPWNP